MQQQQAGSMVKTGSKVFLRSEINWLQPLGKELRVLYCLQTGHVNRMGNPPKRSRDHSSGLTFWGCIPTGNRPGSEDMVATPEIPMREAITLTLALLEFGPLQSLLQSSKLANVQLLRRCQMSFSSQGWILDWNWGWVSLCNFWFATYSNPEMTKKWCHEGGRNMVWQRALIRGNFWMSHHIYWPISQNANEKS